MNNEGGQIREHQIDELRAIALAYDIGTCVQCATAIKAYLKSQQLTGKHIREIGDAVWVVFLTCYQKLKRDRLSI